MDQSGVLPVPEDADVTQAQLDEELVSEIHRGVNVECDGCLLVNDS
jgi:hypothetical protein